MAHRASDDFMPKVGDPRPPKKVETAMTEVGTNLRSHTIQDVEIALHRLAFNGGNAVVTMSQLAEEEKISVTAQTLRKWATISFATRYGEIQHELRNELSKGLAGKLAELGHRTADAQADVMERLEDEIVGMPPKELPGLLRTLSGVGATSIEKAALLRDQPTEIVKDKSPEELLNRLARLNVLPHMSDEPKEIAASSEGNEDT
jgi:hypothetical protein